MKFTKISLVCLGAFALFGCNMGNIAGSDTQNQTVSGGSGANQYSITLVAQGCQTIASNGGTCTVALTYTGSGSYIGLITPSNGFGGYNNNTSTSCPNNSSATSQTCTVTITSNTGTNTGTKQTATFNLGGNGATNINFSIGGGV